MLPRSYQLLLGCALSLAGLTRAQTAGHTHETPSVRVNTPDQGSSIRVRFSEPLDIKSTTDLLPTNITLRSLPGSTTLSVPPAGAAFAAGSLTTLLIQYSGSPAASDTEVEVHFNVIHFGDGHSETDVKAAGPLLTPEKIIELKNADLVLAQKVPTSSSDRNIFASGFVTTASQGTQGGADINLNSLDLGIPDFNAFLQIKKSSVNGGDPKNFETGARYRSVRVWGSDLFKNIHTQLDAYRIATTDAARAAAMNEVATLTQKLQQRVIAATIFDFAFKFEGEATKFNVSNAVGEGSLRLQSMTRSLTGSKHGFWRFQIVAPGFEGGRNLNTAGQSASTAKSETGGALPDVTWLARLKVGAGFSLFYENAESQFPLKRVELEAGGVERYLFFKEPHFDNSTKTVTTTQKGSHPWGEVALKIFVGESDKGRYGFKLAWQRGSLPPVFADTRALNFGFLFETKSPDEKK